MSARLLDACHFAGILSLRKLINYCRIKAGYSLSRLIRRPIHSGMPISLSIEPTTSCTLSCPECPSGRGAFTRPEGKMDFADFQGILGQIKGDLIYLMLYFQGEPLLNPDFFHMIALARKSRIYTATSTNAQHLDDDNARKVVESGLDRLIISLDGTDQQTYENYRVGGDIEKVKDGVRNIIKWKKELRSSRPYVIIQFLVFKANEHQIPTARELAKALGANRLELKSVQVYDYQEDTEFIPQNSKYSRYSMGPDGLWKLKKPSKNRCSRMWSGAVVSWDGRVLPCCFDKDAKHQLGHLDDHSFKEIWKGRKYTEFRKQISEHRSQIDICNNCSE